MVDVRRGNQLRKWFAVKHVGADQVRLLLIRHAQSLGNLGRTGSVSDDPPLTELGLDQASALARAFANGLLPRPDYLLTSLMRRAVQTVVPVAEVLRIPALGRADLHEVGGVYSGDYWKGGGQSSPGLSRTQLLKLYSGLVLPQESTERGWFFRSFETIQEAWPRALRVAAGLLDEYGDTRDIIAVMCHGTFMQLILRALIGWSPTMTGPALDVWIEMNNTGTIMVSVPGRYGDRAWLHWVNRTDHLTAGQLTI